jgi:hypothetical protein
MTTNNGNLIQLVSNEGYSLFQENKISIDNVSLPLHNNQVVIARNADMFFPQYLSSNHPVNYLQLIIGNKVILNFPLDFCNKLSKFDCGLFNSTGTYIYKIPWNILKFEKIPIVALQFQSVIFKIISDFNCTGKLYVCNYFLDNEGRRQLTLDSSNYNNMNIKQFQEQTMNVVANNNHSERLIFSGRIKGIFLDKVNMVGINSLKLLFNGHLRMNYDELMLSFFPMKISDNCYYIPFDNYHFVDTNWNSSINFDSINNITIKLKSNVNQNIIIRALNYNLLRIQSGMSDLQYMYDFCKIKNILKVMEPVIKILEGDPFCPISFVNILKNNHYMKCIQCQKNYISDAILEWLKNKKTCPACRAPWKNMQIYVNCDIDK